MNSKIKARLNLRAIRVAKEIAKDWGLPIFENLTDIQKKNETGSSPSRITKNESESFPNSETAHNVTHNLSDSDIFQIQSISIDYMREGFSLDSSKLNETPINSIPQVFEATPVAEIELGRRVCVNRFDRQKKIIDITQKIEQQNQKIKDFIKMYPEPFRIKEALNIYGTEILIGSSLQFKYYNSIPVFIQKSDDFSKRLIFAYMSKSHDCRRRFAGEWGGIFWKGYDQQLQNFDWRIQKLLDKVYAEHEPVFIYDNCKPLPLQNLSIGYSLSGKYLFDASEIIINSENILQEGPFEPELFVMDYSAKPIHLVDYWRGGNKDGVYGEYMNLIVASEKYCYCVALTADGIFLKYAQAKDSRGINAAGAPLRSLKIPKEFEWMFTPSLEYDTCGVELSGRNGTMKAHPTISLGGNRVRMEGLHESSRSVLFELSNGLSDFYNMIYAGQFDLVENKLQRMISHSQNLPQSKEPYQVPWDDVDDDVMRNYDILYDAFNDFREGHDKEKISKKYQITEKELDTLERYANSLNFEISDNEKLEKHIYNVLVLGKLRTLARRSIQFSRARTVALDLDL